MTDPETKTFVQRIADRELDVYYDEVKHYKEVTKNLMPQLPARATPRKAKKRRNKTRNLPQSDETKFPSPCFFGSANQTPKKQKTFQPQGGAVSWPRFARLDDLAVIPNSVNELDARQTLVKRVCRQGVVNCVSDNDNMELANPVIAEVDISDKEILLMWSSDH